MASDINPQCDINENNVDNDECDAGFELRSDYKTQSHFTSFVQISYS